MQRPDPNPPPGHRARSARALRRAATAACAALALAHGSATLAAPYLIRYTGTVTASGISGVDPDTAYLVALAMDNGGSSAANQTWNASHLRCIVWYFGADGDRVFVQNLTTAPPSTATGMASTDASGALTSMFSQITATPVTGPPGSYAAFNLPPPTEVHWWINTLSPIFRYNGQEISGLAGEVPVAASAWSGPTALGALDTGTCAQPAASPVAKPVPVLGAPALALLGGGLAASAALASRRRARRVRAQ